mgnify:CR=1 FL=1
MDDPDAFATEQLKFADDVFPPDVLSRAVRVTSHFGGWINPEVCARLGIASNAAEAWETNGGGKFSFANPLGTPEGQGEKKPKGGKRSLAGAPSGWSEARYVSSMLLRKNPNAFFYRHTEPGVEQWSGEWTQEEIDLFLEVRKREMKGKGRENERKK